MKVINIIAEGEATNLLLRAFGKRVFKNSAEKLAYTNATAELSEALYKASLDTSKVDAWSIVRKHVERTPMNNKEFVQAIYDDSLKMAEKRFNKEAKAAGKKNGVKQAPAQGTGSFESARGALLDGLTAFGIYEGVKGPIEDYATRMEWAARKLDIGPGNVDPKQRDQQGWSQDQYNQYHKEELGILTGRLAAGMIGFGGGAVGIKALANIAGKVPGFRWLAPSIPDGRVRQMFYVAWAHALDSNLGIPGSEQISKDGKQLTPKQLITSAILAELPIPLVTASTADILGFGARLAENLLHALYKEVYDKVAKSGEKMNLNVDPVWFGFDARPTTPPGKRTPGNGAPTNPSQAPAPKPDAPFNPNDWIKTKSGFYQNKFDNSMISPTEYNERVSGQSSD